MHENSSDRPREERRGCNESLCYEASASRNVAGYGTYSFCPKKVEVKDVAKAVRIHVSDSLYTGLASAHLVTLIPFVKYNENDNLVPSGGPEESRAVRIPSTGDKVLLLGLTGLVRTLAVSCRGHATDA